MIGSNKIKTFLLAGGVVLGALLAAVPAFAATCGGVEVSVLACPEPGGANAEIGDSGVIGILKIAIRVLVVGIGVAAVAGIGWGAIQYATAQDNSSQVQEAIGIIRNVVIGLVVFALMTVFLNFIVPGGVL